MVKKQKKHVVFVAAPEVEGGATKSMLALCQGLLATGEYRITVLTSQRSWLNDTLEAAGARTVVSHHGAFLVPKPQSPWKVVPKWAIFFIRYLYGLVVSVRIAEREIDFSNVDIIHTNVPREDLGAILSKRHGIPHIVHLRECSFSHFRCWSYRRNPVGYLDCGADVFIGISRYVSNYWEHLGISADKVRVIYDGVDAPKDVKKRVLHERPLRLIFLGGYVEPKGVWDAVQAVPILLEKKPNSVSLDVYGGGSAETRGNIAAYVAQHELGDAVSLHGEINDVWPVISEYDVGLACSIDEAFGRTVIEFEACGVVPVVSDSGAFTETVKNDVNGLIYEKKGGAQALAERIGLLVQDPERLERLSSKATVSCRRFTAERNCEGVQNVYDELLSKNQ